ncbi:MAG TPA: hypothetical protein VN728_16265 [Stellaceae bacterium]|nr:hypothetical protein [Stellaceae bacterium]
MRHKGPPFRYRLFPMTLPIFCALLFAGEAKERLVLFQRHRLARLLLVTGLGQEFERARRFAALPGIRSIAHAFGTIAVPALSRFSSPHPIARRGNWRDARLERSMAREARRKGAIDPQPALRAHLGPLHLRLAVGNTFRRHDDMMAVRAQQKSDLLVEMIELLKQRH